MESDLHPKALRVFAQHKHRWRTHGDSLMLSHTNEVARRLLIKGVPCKSQTCVEKEERNLLRRSAWLLQSRV